MEEREAISQNPVHDVFHRHHLAPAAWLHSAASVDMMRGDNSPIGGSHGHERRSDQLA